VVISIGTSGWSYDRSSSFRQEACPMAARFNERPSGSTAFRELTGRRSGADDLLRGPDPEFFEQVGLAARPGQELVELLGV